jgi:hypothetical protein
MYDIDATITCFILCKGSSQFAAAFKWADIGPQTEPIIYKIESVDINFIGKLVFARLNLPVIIYLPICAIIALKADLKFPIISGSTRGNPPSL